MTRPRSVIPALAAAALLSGPTAAFAHGPAAHPSAAIGWQWNLAPVVVVPIAVASWLYLIGLHRLWKRAGVGRGISRRQAVYYLLGILVLVVALLSPLEALSSASFGLHMLQHLLLMVVAPPLLVAGAADVAFLWALPRSRRSGFGNAERRIGGWLGSKPGGTGNRLAVVGLATGMLWLWHVPALYDLALQSEPLHIAEHVSFLVTALLFWAGVLRLRSIDHLRNGGRIVALIAMALQGGMLGALITFSSRPLYASHRDSSILGLEPLVDQQIAGLLMWVPPAFLYLIVLVHLFLRWLDAVNRQRAGTGIAPHP